jgi:hypothetical protein
MARGRRLAQDPGDRVEIVLVGPALARQEVDRERDVAGLRQPPRDVLDVAREAAVLVTHENHGESPGARRAREITVEARAHAGKFRDPRDEIGIVGRYLGRRARGRLGHGGLGLRARVEDLRGERRAGDAGERLQGLAPGEPPLFVILDRLVDQVALQVVHVFRLPLLIRARSRPCAAAPGTASAQIQISAWLSY